MSQKYFKQPNLKTFLFDTVNQKMKENKKVYSFYAPQLIQVNKETPELSPSKYYYCYYINTTVLPPINSSRFLSNQ